MPPRPLLVRTAACLLASLSKAERVLPSPAALSAFASLQGVAGRRVVAKAVPACSAGGVGIVVPTFLPRSGSGSDSDRRGSMMTTRAKSDDGDGSGTEGGNAPDFSAFVYSPSLGTRVPPPTVEPKVEPKEEEEVKKGGGSSTAAKSPKRARAKTGVGTSSKKAKTAIEGAASPSSSPPTTPKRARIKAEAGGTPPKKAETTKEGPSTPASSPPTTPKRRPRTPKPPSSSARKRSPRSPKIEPGSLPPPRNWEATYELVHELRADRTAPVDTDGGEALPERHRGDVVYRFQVLTALMLSSQTKDAVVGETMRGLQRHGLDVETIHRTTPEDLNALIRKVGFHNNKTKYLKKVAEILIEQYGGDIPPTAIEMMKLPGVGPKMSFIVESIVFDNTTGIGVDTHMHRMFNDLKWVDSKTPEKTREQLEGWLPRDKWAEVNVLWVGIGQETQQQKEKSLRKAIGCSRPAEALGLIKKLGVDLKKEGKKHGLEEEIRVAFMGEN